MEPDLPHGEPGHRPVGRAVQDRAGVGPRRITLVQNPKWWGTPANARSITVHIASSTAQLAQWMASGYVQVAQPTTVTPALPDPDDGPAGGAERGRHVGHPAAARHGELARTRTSRPTCAFAIALSINRQDLVNQQVSWAVPGIAPWQQPPRPSRASRATSRPRRAHRPRRSRRRRRRRRPPSSGAGGSVNFPVTPVPDQAAAFIAASGLDRDARRPVLPLGLRRALPAAHGLRLERPLGGRGGTGDPRRAGRGGPGHDVATGRRRRPDGAGPGGGVRRPGRPAGDLHALHEPDAGVVHDVAGAAGEERLRGLDGLLEQPVRPAGADGVAAAEPEHGGWLLQPGGHAAVGRDGLAAALRRAGRLVWSRTIGGVHGACPAARASCGTPSCGRSGHRSRPATPRRRCRGSRGVDAAGPNPVGSGLFEARARRWADDARATISGRCIPVCKLVGVAE